MAAKILLIDIETAPILADVWGLFKQNVGLSQIEAHPYVLCWAAKWYGDDTIYWDALPEYKRTYRRNKENDIKVVSSARDMLDEADIVVGHNIRAFDNKWLKGRMMVHDMVPPSPYKMVDTLSAARQNYKLASNRLDYLGKILGYGGKNKTDFDLWKNCMDGDPDAWDEMVKYNIKDVELLEDVYTHMLPWIQNHPNVNLYDDDETMRCANCGSEEIKFNGHYYTNVGKFRRAICKSCGHTGRVRVSENTKEKRASILSQVPNG